MELKVQNIVVIISSLVLQCRCMGLNLARIGSAMGDTFSVYPANKQNGVLQMDQSNNVGEKWTPPPFCRGLDCPQYTNITTAKDYQLREYVPSTWVSTDSYSIDYKDATSVMFRRLFDYISGDNVAKQKIAMTAPVTMHVIPGAGPACENNFTQSFFISTSLTNPPEPTNGTKVYLNSLPKRQVYVRAFGGFAKTEDWIENAKLLGESLDRDKQTYNKDYFYTAGYNSPFTLFNRHNEVWIPKE